MKRYTTVDEFIQDQTQWSNELSHLRKIIAKTGLKEGIKWGFPVFTSNGKNVVGMGSFKSYFGLWFYQGALLKDAANKLINAQEGKTRAMRQWRMNDASDIEEALILSYIDEAIKHQKAGREIKSVSQRESFTSDLLSNALNESAELKTAFEKLTPYKQREYLEYLATAKMEATRRRRLEKILPMIKAGIGLSDKYR